MVAVELAMEMYVAGYDVAAFWDNGDGGDCGHEADIFSLKHESSIFRQSSNPVGGFSMMDTDLIARGFCRRGTTARSAFPACS